jgi:hypothetical protein
MQASCRYLTASQTSIWLAALRVVSAQAEICSPSPDTAFAALLFRSVGSGLPRACKPPTSGSKRGATNVAAGRDSHDQRRFRAVPVGCRRNPNHCRRLALARCRYLSGKKPSIGFEWSPQSHLLAFRSTMGGVGQATAIAQSHVAFSNRALTRAFLVAQALQRNAELVI